MISPSLRSVARKSKDRYAGRMVSQQAAVRGLVFLVPMIITGIISAQDTNSTDSDKQTIQLLVKRIDQLEARLAQLESARSTTAGPTSEPAPVTPTLIAASEPESAEERAEPERTDVSKTLLKIRGFGDVTFHGDTRKGDTTSFTLGQLDLFVTSDISEKFKFLSEIVFTAGQNNAFGVDVERYLLQYSPNDYFNLSAGRFHTAIGYYNTAYHHSTWLQTATGRPFLFQFDDSGGILPIHNIGLSATGLIPSRGLGLHYVAEIGNGRASLTPQANPVQNAVDENNGKAFNLGLFARPTAIRGLQAGISVYHDGRTPVGLPEISETIVAAHAVLIRPSFEWLNEALLIRHAPSRSSQVFETPGFYTQVSRAFGAYRPYFRYQYVNASDAEPLFPEVGLRHGPSVGLRYDPSEWVALKLQYDYTVFRHEASTNALGLQIGFTF